MSIKKILFSLTFFSILLTASFVYAAPAGTHVGGTISRDIVWTEKNSPYILDSDLNISGAKLTIEAGVSISLNPSISTKTYLYVSDSGSLFMNGTRDNHTQVGGGIYQLMISYSTTSIAYTDFDGTGIVFVAGATDISSSTFKNNSAEAITVLASNLHIDSSIIENNKTGISVRGNVPGWSGRYSSIVMSGTILENNIKQFEILGDKNTVDVRNNWWGSDSGPDTTTWQGIQLYKPWLSSKPGSSICCSSILFIPGLEASWLSKPDNTLWAPNRNDDVRKLFLNSNGKSSDSSIYSGTPIGSIFGLYSVYGDFMSFLDKLVSDKKVNEWYGFGYDWRKPISEVVLGSEQKATTTESLVAKVEELASRSRTGKVTIIAHSNGGLVSKYLARALADIGKSDLIDSVISVAVPYLGTPQAITALLYGDTEEIAHGLILKKSVAVELGKNMPSAYSLLPSEKYNSVIANPVIGSSSISFPNASLMASAGSLHGSLDNFSWPSTIKRWAIVGWNVLTAKLVSFSDKVNTIQSNMGDGTVIAKSAMYDAGTTTLVDLSQAGARDISHANILESPSAQTIVKTIISNNDSISSTEDSLKNIQGVTLADLDLSKEKSYIVVSTHSPVDLHVYDEKGKHVGFIPKPAGVPQDNETFSFFENGIAGSKFETIETQDASHNNYDSYVYIPDQIGSYSIRVEGNGIGPVNLDIAREKAGEVIEHVSYTDIPATPLSIATATISIAPLGTSASSSLILSAPTFSLDVDGNGIVDNQIKPNTQTDPVLFLESMKKTIIYLLGTSPKAKNVIRRIDHLEDLARAGKISRLHDTSVRFSSHFAHRSIKGINDTDRLTIVNMIDDFLTHIN